MALAEQATFLLPVRPTLEQAREREPEQKFNVFGRISKLFVRPKGEEIEISSQCFGTILSGTGLAPVSWRG